MSKDEKVIFQKLTHNLHKVGDKIAASEIYPGEWLKVCINPTDKFSGIESGILKVHDVEVINDVEPTSSEATWGLYFVYPNNKIVYYSFPNNKIIADPRRGYPLDGKNCENKENAFLKVLKTNNERLAIGLESF